LISLSGALDLKTTGTVHALIAQVKSHLDAHPEIQNNIRFSGLFLPSHRHQMDDGLKNSEEMGIH